MQIFPHVAAIPGAPSLSRIASVARQALMTIGACAILATPLNAQTQAAAAGVQARFAEPVATQRWTISQLGLPADWSEQAFLVVEMKASSSQRFELGIDAEDGFVSKRIHPLANVWVRASIPLEFYRKGLGDAVDLAATVNMPHDSYWINIEAGGHGPIRKVRGLSVTMRYPVGAPTLEIRSVTVSKTDPGDAILDGKPILDQFGQYARVDWDGKARTAQALKAEWTAETAALHTAAATPPNLTQYGGFTDRRSRATGFFRVEKVDGRWWFVDPEGALFWSTGVNGIGPGSATRVEGRESYFETIPPAQPTPAGATVRPGQRRQTSFHGANLALRYGADWRPAWADDTARRMRVWGLNTAYSATINEQPGQQVKIPYVATLRGWQTQGSIMGMPDVYSPDFEKRVDQLAAEQAAPRANDPWLIGYFIGNEPPWPGRESQLVDLVLAGPPSELANRFRQELVAKGDTPESRKAMVLAAFARYLEVINKAVKRHDPNHLNLGIRFGGTPPMDVVRLAKGFDVYSMNKYRWAPPKAMMDEVYAALDLPILIGEFHIGVPGRGMAPGLVQAMNQTERGQAYSYYVENAAAHPAVIGTHWFQWADQPATGRSDGENYNIGWVDVTDRPYGEFVARAVATHGRIAAIHAGQASPTTVLGKASDVGTPVDAIQLGIPAIQ